MLVLDEALGVNCAQQVVSGVHHQPAATWVETQAVDSPLAIDRVLMAEACVPVGARPRKTVPYHHFAGSVAAVQALAIRVEHQAVDVAVKQWVRRDDFAADGLFSGGRTCCAAGWH